MIQAPDWRAALSAREVAAAYRARWLVGVAQGMITLDEFIEHAATERGKPLRRVLLSTLLTSQAGWGETRMVRVLRRLARASCVPVSDCQRLSVAWLLDGRSRSRFDAWNQARRDPVAPWPGFPFAPPPARPGEGS